MHFSQDLKHILNTKFDVIKIARWSDHFYATHIKEISEKLDEVLMAHPACNMDLNLNIQK